MNALPPVRPAWRRTARRTARLPELLVLPLVGGLLSAPSANDCYGSAYYRRTSTAWARPSRLAQLSGQLSTRDLAVLHSLGHVRLLSATQIERLHFREGSALTQARRSRRCLTRLHELDLIHRLERRIGGLQAGSSGFIYGLTGWGQRLVAANGPAGGERRRRPWEPSPPFQNHVLAVSELFVRLHEADRTGLLELISFEAEPGCWRTYQAPDGQRRILKPDAMVVTAEPDFEHLSFVEVDLGTEGTTAIRRKAETYRQYHQSGSEQQRLGVFPRTVFLASSEERVAQLRSALSAVADTADLFVVGTFEAAIALLGGAGP